MELAKKAEYFYSEMKSNTEFKKNLTIKLFMKIPISDTHFLKTVTILMFLLHLMFVQFFA